MMIMKNLEADRERANWLSAALTRANEESGRRALPGDLKNRLNAALATFDAALTQKRLAYKTRRQAVEARLELLASGRRLVRQAWSGLHNRVARGELRVSDLEHYKLPTDGSRPNPYRYEDWLAAGQLLLQGNSEAVEAGFPAVSEPPVEQLTTLVTNLAAAQSQVHSAKAALKVAIIELKQARALVRLLMREIARYLRSRNLGLTGPELRELLRDYGYRFISKGGPSDAGDGETGTNPGTDTTGSDTGDGTDGTDDDGTTPTEGGTDTGDTGSETPDDGTNPNTGSQTGDNQPAPATAGA